MPPQQAHGLLDLGDRGFGFSAHFSDPRKAVGLTAST
jgi:hypothetical protein